MLAWSDIHRLPVSFFQRIAISLVTSKGKKITNTFGTNSLRHNLASCCVNVKHAKAVLSFHVL